MSEIMCTEHRVAAGHLKSLKKSESLKMKFLFSWRNTVGIKCSEVVFTAGKKKKKKINVGYFLYP